VLSRVLQTRQRCVALSLPLSSSPVAFPRALAVLNTLQSLLSFVLTVYLSFQFIPFLMEFVLSSLLPFFPPSSNLTLVVPCSPQTLQLRRLPRRQDQPCVPCRRVGPSRGGNVRLPFLFRGKAGIDGFLRVEQEKWRGHQAYYYFLRAVGVWRGSDDTVEQENASFSSNSRKSRSRPRSRCSAARHPSPSPFSAQCALSKPVRWAGKDFTLFLPPFAPSFRQSPPPSLSPRSR
jgi:hypothetical protein